MAKAVRKPRNAAKSEATVFMQAPVRLRKGTRLFYPYSIEVAAGEPSYWKRIHNKYHDQFCTIVAIAPGKTRKHASIAYNYDTCVTVRFEDGHEEEDVDPTTGFIFIG